MTEIIVRIVTWVIGLIAGLTSDLQGASNLSEYISIMNNTLNYVFEIFDYVNFIIPINVIFTCLLIIVTLRCLAIMWNFVEWIILRLFDVIP